MPAIHRSTYLLSTFQRSTFTGTILLISLLGSLYTFFLLHRARRSFSTSSITLRVSLLLQIAVYISEAIRMVFILNDTLLPAWFLVDPGVTAVAAWTAAEILLLGVVGGVIGRAGRWSRGQGISLKDRGSGGRWWRSGRTWDVALVLAVAVMVVLLGMATALRVVYTRQQILQLGQLGRKMQLRQVRWFMRRAKEIQVVETVKDAVEMGTVVVYCVAAVVVRRWARKRDNHGDCGALHVLAHSILPPLLLIRIWRIYSRASYTTWGLITGAKYYFSGRHNTTPLWWPVAEKAVVSGGMMLASWGMEKVLRVGCGDAKFEKEEGLLDDAEVWNAERKREEMEERWWPTTL